MLSELMENATQYSPPETVVEVTGRRLLDGSYEIQIADRGIGMAQEQMDEANTLFANPPLVGLSLSRSLGFIGVGRLAARHGIKVELRSSMADSGTTALVTLPLGALAGGADHGAMIDPVME